VSLSGVTAIGAGEYHSIALVSTSDVYTWGSNSNGQLGTGNTSNVSTPALVTTGAASLGAGIAHSLVVKTNGTVWATGWNPYGALGDGTTTQRTSFVQMGGSITTATKAVGGRIHSLILLSDGSMKATGYNGWGALGDGTTTQRTTPVIVSTVSNITAIAAGFNHSIARKSDGTLWVWGGNSDGQLGDGTNSQRNTPQQITSLSSTDQIGAGHDHTVAVTSTGVVYTWGKNDAGQLGSGTTSSRSTPATISGTDYVWNVAPPVFSPAAGTYNTNQTVVVTCETAGATIHYTQNGAEPTEADPTIASGSSIVVSTTQTLKAKAFKSLLPESDTTSATYTLKPVMPSFTPAAGTYTSPQDVTMTTSTTGATIRYTTDGSTPSESSATYTAPVNVATTTTLKAVAIKSGWTTSDIRTGTYTMNFGTLAAPSVSPAAGAYESSVTIEMSSPDAIATIRYTTNGSTPTASSTVYAGPFVLNVTATVKAKAFHPDYTTSPETAVNYTIQASPPAFTVGTGTHSPGTLVTITSPEPTATIRITLNGADPTTQDPSLPSGTVLVVGGFVLKARAFRSGATNSAITAATYTLSSPLSAGVVAAGGSQTLLATPEGLLYAWGLNSSGQLGDGTTSNRLAPILVPTLTGVAAIDGGDSHTVAATYDGRLFAWGSNGSGRLGDGTTTNRSRPIEITALNAVVMVAAGSSHSMALTSGGNVYAWGLGSSGQLGLGSTDSQSVPTLISSLSNVSAIAAGASHSLAVTSNGELYAWRANNSSQLGDGTTQTRTSPVLISGISDVVAVAAGSSHTAALTRDGSVYVWGAGSNGQLGLGDTASRTVPTKLTGLTAIAIAAGNNHNLALRVDAVLVAWGLNTSGQIGDGSTTLRTSPVVVAGPASVTTIATGGSHTVAVAPDGAAWTWGAGTSGQLGDGGNTSRSTPASVFVADGRWAPSAPSFSLGSGTFDAPQVVNVASTTSGAIVRYTTSGVEPTENDAEIPVSGEIAIEGTVTLRARAWTDVAKPSAVTTATYVLQPAVPTISPGSGTYTAAQTVSLATTTSSTTIRYTLDGTDPTAASTEYTGPFTVTTSLTVKARAFRTGWTPSVTGTATYQFEYGTLATPVADLPGSRYHPGTTVSLSAESGTTIRYTLDGTDPAPVSNVYAGPITLPNGATTLKARAFRTDWIPSGVLTVDYFITSDWTPPTITAVITPAPNAAGWNNTNVTVTFTCEDADSTVTFCSPPQSLQQEGATQVTGTARDAALNEASVTLTVSIDKTPPVLRRHVPRDWEVFPPETSTVIVRGSVADFTSGVDSVSCGAVAGDIAGQTFTCEIPVGVGSTPLTIEARDRSGHTRTNGVTIVVGDQPPPMSISISPATMTMIQGETRRLTVSDERDRRVTGGTWTVSNPTVAEVVVENDEVSVRAVGGGQATLILSRDALTAEATVDVLLAGSTPPSGTTLWSLTPATPDPVLRGEVLRALWVDAPDGVEHPSLFFVDEGIEWAPKWVRRWERPTRIRATTVDGRELWEHLVEGPIIRQVAADNHGGLTFLLESWHDENGQFYPDTIRRLDGFTGAVSWEYSAAFTNASTSSLTEFAIHPDGRVFVVEDGGGPDNITDLIALDGASGLESRWQLPGGAVHDGPTAAIATHPLVREDGSVVLLSNRWGITSEVQLVTLPSAGGQLSLQAVNGTAANWTGIVALNGYRIMPDGQGGLLITNNVFEKHAGDGTSAWRLDTNYVVSARVNLAAPGFGETGTVYHADYVLAEDGAYALFEGQGQTGYWAKAVAFDPVNLTVTSQAFLSMPGVLPRYLQTRMALGGGGVYISGPFEAYAVNASVDASAFGAGGNAAHVTAEEWTGWSGGPATAIGGHVVHAVTTYSQPQGGRGHKEQDPRLGIFGKTHDVGFLALATSRFESRPATSHIGGNKPLRCSAREIRFPETTTSGCLEQALSRRTL